VFVLSVILPRVEFMVFNFCQKSSLLVTKGTDSGFCRCLNLSIILAACESVNSAIDFTMIGMAIYIVRELKTSSANKLKLGTLFAFGGLSVQPHRH
jgi:hypothetical protein